MPERFHRTLPADPAAPSLLRQAFRRWLAELGWPSDESADLVMAVDEAVTNAVEHAYLGCDQPEHRDTSVEVSARVEYASYGQHRIRIEIQDHGSWKPVPVEAGYRGRGLAMMRAFSDSLEIATSEAGTRICMRSQPVGRASPVSGHAASRSS